MLEGCVEYSPRSHNLPLSSGRQAILAVLRLVSLLAQLQPTFPGILDFPVVRDVHPDNHQVYFTDFPAGLESNIDEKSAHYR